MYPNAMDENETTQRDRPVVHSPVDAIVCDECRRLETEVTLFDPQCPGCQQLLYDESTSVAQMFAVLRQWAPQIQQNASIIIDQMLKAGAHIDDRDGLTDMTILHYACKSGARGVGSSDGACKLVETLLSQGADPYIRCRWTNMAAIHYAAFFDVGSVIGALLDVTKRIDIDSPCSEFDNGTPLHIAAQNMAISAAAVLLENGAYPCAKDSHGNLPIDCVPDPQSFEPDSEAAMLSGQLRQMLLEAKPAHDSLQPSDNGAAYDLLVAQTLQTIDVAIGDRVVVGGAKTGVLRYCGRTLFASGLWAGIELYEAAGKNNGSIDGIPYFHCPPNYGIFAPVNKISKPGSLLTAPSRSSLHRLSYGKVEVGHITAKVDTGLKQQSRPMLGADDLVIGDSVLVAGKRTGIVCYVGPTDFASGLWFGIELSKAVGKNDGSVNGKRYFTCAPQHGVFAPPSRVQRLLDGVMSASSNDVSLSSANIPQHFSGDNSATQYVNVPIKSSMKAKPVIGPVRSSVISTQSAINTMSNGELKLTEGSTVFCSGDMGVIRYIGPVDFAEGVWLGVELKTARGKHDGSVQGHRYFTCRPGHGLLVRPGRVSVRGISGSQLKFD